MGDVAAAATAIANAITTSLATSQAAPTVHINPFSGGPTDDFRVFKEQIRSSITLAQVPDAGKIDFLKLHLAGGALSYFLELPAADKADLATALTALERRYFSANQLEFYKLKFQERKFDMSKETPEDFLTDLTKLANFAFANSGGVDRSGERSRRIRDAFIAGMPTQLRLKLLMRPDTDTVDTLCTQVSKRLVLKSILPDKDSISTAFNAVSNDQASNSLTQVLNSVVEAQKDLAQTQKNIGQQILQIDKSVRQVSRGGTNRGRRNGNNRNNFGQRYNHNLSPGSWTNYRQPFPRSQYNQPQGQTDRARFNPGICRICGQPGHMQRDCLLRQPAQRGGNIPFNYYRGNSKN